VGFLFYLNKGVFNMSIIQIIIQGTELENVTVNLDTEQVTALYVNQQKNLKEITDLTKKVQDSEYRNKTNNETIEKINSELQQAHGLLSALGIDDKTKEEVYYRKQLARLHGLLCILLRR
jgi:mevalonate kinase